MVGCRGQKEIGSLNHSPITTPIQLKCAASEWNNFFKIIYKIYIYILYRNLSIIYLCKKEKENNSKTTMAYMDVS